MPQLKLTRFVEIHDLAVQQNVQPNSRYWNINEVRVCSFVRQRLAAVLERFHVYAPIPPKRGFGADYVSNAWLRKKLSTAVAGSGVWALATVPQSRPVR